MAMDDAREEHEAVMSFVDRRLVPAMTSPVNCPCLSDGLCSTRLADATGNATVRTQRVCMASRVPISVF